MLRTRFELAIIYLIIYIYIYIFFFTENRLNPARDFAPRLVSYMAGWGPGVFSFRGYNSFWIYIVGKRFISIGNMINL